MGIQRAIVTNKKKKKIKTPQHNLFINGCVSDARISQFLNILCTWFSDDSRGLVNSQMLSDLTCLSHIEVGASTDKTARGR